MFLRNTKTLDELSQRSSRMQQAKVKLAKMPHEQQKNYRDQTDLRGKLSSLARARDEAKTATRNAQANIKECQMRHESLLQDYNRREARLNERFTAAQRRFAERERLPREARNASYAQENVRHQQALNEFVRAVCDEIASLQY